MKKMTQQILIACTLVLCGSVQAQWTYMGGGLSTGADFNDFYAVDSNIIYVGGINGFLKKTTDGTNWAYAKNGLPTSTFIINSLHCTDANTCFAAGTDDWGNSAFWTTTDGAASWQASPNPVAIADIFFINTIGYGTAGYSVYKTINSGNDWVDVSPPLQSIDIIQELYFTSVDVGFIVGDDRLVQTDVISYAKILKTIDGGANWTSVYTGSVEGSVIMDITFINNSIGYAVGTDSTVLKTIDGGSTWNQLDLSTGLGENTGTAAFISVAFANQYTGIIVNNSNVLGAGTVKKTIDGGLTWVTELLPNYGYVARMPHKNKGFVLEGSGGLYESSAPGDQISNVIEEMLSNNVIQIYPNPITNQSIIKMEEYTHSMELHLLDISGKEVAVMPLSGSETKFEGESLLSGLYFYRVTTENNIISTGKIIIE